MMQFFRHFFTPHHTNNQRAKLLHNSSIFLVVCLLFLGSFAISFTKSHYQNVLGVSASISSQDLLNLTNQQRAAAGLAPLSLNDQLAQAAAGKAEDMFTNNYWAHISPNGTTPWGFIRGAGYNYTYAGENLARGYTSASDVMNAWMASPEHRANILSSHYSDVGFAVAEGNLTGDSGTVLVVEEFGSRVTVPQQAVPLVQQAAAAGQPTSAPIPTITTAPVASTTPIPKLTPTPKPQVLTQVTTKPFIDSKKATQAVGIALLIIFIALLLLDMLIVGRRKLIRIVGHNLDHIIFFVTIIIIAIMLGQGVIY